MTLSPQSPMTTKHPPDDVDRWFTDFFQVQLPNPFPPAPRTAVAEPARPRRGAADHGRLTLAASVAALLAFGVYLSYGPTGDLVPAAKQGAFDMKDTTAGGKGGLHKHMPPPAPSKLP